MNLIVDYFQPLNKSHIQVAQKLYEKNGRKAVFIAVSQSNRPARYPIPSYEVETILEEAKSTYEFIADTFIVDSWNIEAIIQKLQGKYFPSVIACTTKRVKDYSMQLEFHFRYNPRSPFKKTMLIEVDHNDFGDDLQSSLFEKKYHIFRHKTPEFMHKHFDCLSEYYNPELQPPSQQESQQKLHDHFKFLKMVINDDSTVHLKSSLVEALNNAKRNLEVQEEVDFIKTRCIARGFKEEEAVEFINQVVLQFDTESIAGFYSKLQQGERLSHSRANLIRLNDSFTGWGISPEFILRAITFKPTGRDNFGGGEFLTTILFNGAYKAEVGDVMIDDYTIEVKNNDGLLHTHRTINGQSAYADISTIASNRAKWLNDELLENYNLKGRTPSALKHIIWETSKSGDFNITQKGIKKYLDIIRKCIKIHGVENKGIFYAWFEGLFKGGVFNLWYYIGNTTDVKIEDDLRSMVDKAVAEEITPKDLLSYLTFMAFKYYARIDGFDSMIVYRSKSSKSTAGYCANIPSDIDYTKYSELIEPVMGPSITDPRSSKAFKIRLKDVRW